MDEATLTGSPNTSFPFLPDWNQGFSQMVSSAALAAGVLQRDVDQILLTNPGRTHLATHLSGMEGVTPHIALSDLRSHDASAVALPGGMELWGSPHEVYLRIVRSSGKGSRRESSERTSFVHDVHSQIGVIAEALALVREVAPGFFADTVAFTSAIAILDDQAAFRGASGLTHAGLSFFSPDATWDRLVWAEELVHEGTHNLLDAVDAQRPLLVGDGVMDEVHQAPLRPDKRPLYGNFHAMIVLARLARLDSALVGLHLSDAEAVALEKRVTGYMTAGRLVYESLCTHVSSMSDVGRSLLVGLAAPVFDG